jgi:hypothetical protein
MERGVLVFLTAPGAELFVASRAARDLWVESLGRGYTAVALPLAHGAAAEVNAAAAEEVQRALAQLLTQEQTAAVHVIDLRPATPAADALALASRLQARSTVLLAPAFGALHKSGTERAPVSDRRVLVLRPRNAVAAESVESAALSFLLQAEATEGRVYHAWTVPASAVRALGLVRAMDAGLFARLSSDAAEATAERAIKALRTGGLLIAPGSDDALADGPDRASAALLSLLRSPGGSSSGSHAAYVSAVETALRSAPSFAAAPAAALQAFAEALSTQLAAAASVGAAPIDAVAGPILAFVANDAHFDQQRVPLAAAAEMQIAIQQQQLHLRALPRLLPAAGQLTAARQSATPPPRVQGLSNATIAGIAVGVALAAAVAVGLVLGASNNWGGHEGSGSGSGSNGGGVCPCFGKKNVHRRSRRGSVTQSKRASMMMRSNVLSTAPGLVSQLSIGEIVDVGGHGLTAAQLTSNAPGTRSSLRGASMRLDLLGGQGVGGAAPSSRALHNPRASLNLATVVSGMGYDGLAGNRNSISNPAYRSNLGRPTSVNMHSSNALGGMSGGNQSGEPPLVGITGKQWLAQRAAARAAAQRAQNAASAILVNTRGSDAASTKCSGAVFNDPSVPRLLHLSPRVELRKVTFPDGKPGIVRRIGAGRLNGALLTNQTSVRGFGDLVRSAKEANPNMALLPGGRPLSAMTAEDVRAVLMQQIAAADSAKAASEAAKVAAAAATQAAAVASQTQTQTLVATSASALPPLPPASSDHGSNKGSPSGISSKSLHRIDEEGEEDDDALWHG